MKSKIIISLLCVLVSAISLIVVYKYPVGDWVSSPFIIKFILIPFLLIEIVSIVLLMQEIKPKLFLILQIIFAILSLLVMLNYIRVH